MSRTERSRSPHGELALALPASSSVPLPRSFDLDKMELTLDGTVVKVYRFADDPEMPWFQAKPIVTYLGYKNITQTLEDNVYPEDKSALQALIYSKGTPLGVVISQITTLGYHELKAIHINEPALYSLIFGSRKKEAIEFKRWVCTAVLPSIRRKGFFGNLAVTLKARDDELKLALKERDGELQLTLQIAEANFHSTLAERWQALTIFFQPLTGLVSTMTTLPHNLAMSVRGCVKDVIDTAVTSTDSKLVKVFRAATKPPAKRKTSNPLEFPESQRASAKQKVNILTLAKVAMQEFPQNELHYNTWEMVRSCFGKRSKAERLRCNALGPADGAFVAQPLLWCNGVYDGCTQRYMYLESHRQLLQRIWHWSPPPRGESLHDMAVRVQKTARSTPGYVEKEWPEDVMEQDPSGWKFPVAASP